MIGIYTSTREPAPNTKNSPNTCLESKFLVLVLVLVSWSFAEEMEQY